MTRTQTAIPTLLTLILIFLCGCGQTNHNDSKKTETPKALQDEKLEITSYSRSGDLIEELYAELVDKTPQLKMLEEDLKNFKQVLSKKTAPYNNYNNHSSAYYNSADFNANSIKDSLLRKRMMNLIATSKTKYANQSSDINNLISQIAYNGATINDHHSVLKIVLTLPIIEKYQTENLPTNQDFHDLIKQQQIIKQRIDTLTPKF